MRNRGRHCFSLVAVGASLESEIGSLSLTHQKGTHYACVICSVTPYSPVAVYRLVMVEVW
jgi:hypothetical protein